MTTTSSNPLRYAWFVVALLFPVALRDPHVALNVIFGVFAGVALLSVFIVLLIKPHEVNSSK